MQGLQQFLLTTQYQVVNVGVDQYRVYGNGTVTSNAGAFVTTGGVQGLQAYLKANQYQSANINGKTYRLYPNQTVTDATGKVLSASGGMAYLQQIASGQVVVLYNSEANDLFLSDSRRESGNNAIAVAGVLALVAVALIIVTRKRNDEKDEKEKKEIQEKLNESLIHKEINF